jgi:hypothetical protein
MFVVTSNGAYGAYKMDAAAKMSILMMVVSFGTLFLTLHTYVLPTPPPPPGFRIFGFPRPPRRAPEPESYAPPAKRHSEVSADEIAEVASRLADTRYTSDAFALLKAFGCKIDWVR